MKLKYLNFFKEFEKKQIEFGVPTQLKYVMSKISQLISNDIKNNKSFEKILDFSGDPYFSTKIHLKVYFNKSNFKLYKGNIDIWNLTHSDENNSNIDIIINDEEINKDELIPLIAHEMRHVYDLLYSEEELDIKSYLKLPIINLYKKQLNEIGKFCHLVYLSLENEMISRNNMLYFRILPLKIDNKYELIKKIENTSTYKIFDILNDFNSKEFINSNDYNELSNFVNEFSKDMYENITINNRDELLKYFENWEFIFKESVKKYKEYLNNIIDDVIKEVHNEKIIIDEYYISSALEIIKNIHHEILLKVKGL